MSYLVSISDFAKYAGGGMRKFIEGEEVMNASHIMYMGITLESVSKIELLCLCVKSSDLFGMPHELLIKITKDDVGRKTLECKCSCKAGSPTCKHIIGSLEYLIRNEKNSIEVATCTDVTQKWGKLKNDVEVMYAKVPIKSHCHGKQSKSLKVKHLVDQNIKTYSMEVMTVEDPNFLCSSMALLIHGPVRSTPQVLPLAEEDSYNYLEPQESGSILSAPICNKMQEDDPLDNVEVDLEAAIDLCTKTKSQSGRIWRLNRRKRMTGANAYKYITPLRYNEAVNWANKIKSQLESSFKGNENTAHGVRMEPKARARYAEVTGHVVIQTGSLVNPCIPWLLVSLDGLVLNSHTIEIKCPVNGKEQPVRSFMGSLPYITESEPNVYSLKKKHTYYCQVQLGMFVSNLRRCDFIVYSSYEDNFEVVQVPYDAEAIQEYLGSLSYVYFGHMLKYLTAADSVSDIDMNDMDGNVPRRAFDDLTNK
ncbi:hypothetical protein QAD02_021206 [Eretmocerus hayati]|uniref:Uncharacterized protein n=1 Tax=Eretmocerus hayati TaxID=131215 RepID=A0ACC2PQL3_9HYME|nr:hypothetical protein QAD02_021206 [Eretmocerus hayati]